MCKYIHMYVCVIAESSVGRSGSNCAGGRTYTAWVIY